MVARPSSSADRRQRRRAALAAIDDGRRLRYPESLPITPRRDDLLEVIAGHQVVIVAGETGSGKSTQLPKLCLELGRGVQGIIGHTQPRRVAARTIAERVAEELGSALGDDVGYSVRFNDRMGDGTLIRVMTDGILLAELQRDRLLRRYDTLIIDEAHERSLNIDFILGYLRQLLPQRSDLKVIVTSATIDTERFSRHFSDAAGRPAPIIEVTGRTYPVEVRYRPFGPDRTDGPRDDERDQVQAVCDAVRELAGENLPGDVLVFLSGEREIHDTADALRRVSGAGTEILPLYARLSSAEQHRIFQPHRGRRIVLSTNVAETSITVPGVRFVVDTGVARISRYSRRLKVQRLPIEPISQASANQRAGRCGRIAPGICIRLFGEDDFASRDEFTEPEILRTNLASVILQMTALDLGDVASFPFVERPDTAAVRDGYLLLEELGAIAGEEDDRRLTTIGRRLARLPVDPRIGRMVLQAAEEDCVREVLVIAAALSIQDPRERPLEHRQAADEAHRRFDVAGSDLLSVVRLWDHLRERQRHLSTNQFRKLCRADYLNYLRVREWQDLFSQLRQLAGEVGVHLGTHDAHPDRVHRAVLSGLLSHIGMRDAEGRQYRGARGASFVIAPGSVLARKSARWVMAAELVETDRLRARRVATISPEWAERAGAHLVRRSYGEPRWDARRGAAVVPETVTLYGLPIVSGRSVPYDRVDPAAARQLFIRHALMEGEWDTHHAFLVRNQAFLERVRAMEARVRRVGLLDDDAVEAFYDRVVGAEVTSGRRFDRWWRDAPSPDVLDLTEDLIADTLRLADHPDTWRHGDLVLPLSYRFDPGGPLDGVIVHVPLTALNQVTDDGFDWQIPGYRRELVGALVRTLPKDVRRSLIPAAATTAAAADRLGPPRGRLVDELAAVLSDVAGVPIRADAFRPEQLPAHLRVNFVVSDADGTVLDADSDLTAIRARLTSVARAAIAGASTIEERRGIVTWDVGTVPREVTTVRGRHVVRGYPALLDEGDSVSLRVLTNTELQHRVMRGGVRRLLLLTAGPSMAAVRRGLTGEARRAIAATVSLDDLAGDAALAAVDDVLTEHGDVPWDAGAFADVQQVTRRDAPALAAGALAGAAEILAAAARVRARTVGMVAEPARPAVADIEAHLARLVRPGFVLAAGTRRLPDVLRYVRGIEYRRDRLAADLPRDTRRMAEVVPLERRYHRYVQSLGPGPPPAQVADFAWQLEELRVSVFAQPIGARGSVSVTKVRRALDALHA